MFWHAADTSGCSVRPEIFLIGHSILVRARVCVCTQGFQSSLFNIKAKIHDRVRSQKAVLVSETSMIPLVVDPARQKELLAELRELQPKPPRSKLEPHLELIRELRRKGRTYREIARLFQERLGLHAAPSTLHSFIKVRARHLKRVHFELPAAVVVDSMQVAPFKTTSIRNEPKKPRFVFRENEPLTLARDGGDR
jgi:hypothetical protein